MTPADMVIADLEGRVVEGSLRPSSDLATHVALYRAFPLIAALSTRTRAMPPRGRSRARDSFFAPLTRTIFTALLPVTGHLTAAEIEGRL